ncbi:MAG: hypothetical protein M1838_001106 [Thelocarpon superellum]|nr:MAG: hypothetical protein M1838_001106 [Thelocarpon superellum]
MFNSTATPTCIPPGDEACGVSSPFIGLHYREDAQAFCPAFFRWASTFAGNGTCCSSGSSSSSSSSSNFAVNDAGSGSSNGNNNSSCSAPSQLPISEPWMPDLVAMQWLAATVNLHQIGINGSVSPANASSAPTSAINPNVSIPQIVIESSTETFGGAGVDGSVNATMPIYLSVISSSTYTTFESYVGGTAQEPGHDNFLVQWLIDPYRMYAQALWADYPQGECKTGEA